MTPKSRRRAKNRHDCRDGENQAESQEDSKIKCKSRPTSNKVQCRTASRTAMSVSKGGILSLDLGQWPIGFPP